MADKDEERDDRDSDAPEAKKQPAKKSVKESKAKEPANLDDILIELKEIKELMRVSQAGSAPHLWLLFPIAAAVLIQAIFMAMRL